MKKFLIFLIVLFILGMLVSDVAVSQVKDTYNLLNLEKYIEYANAKIQFNDVFESVIYERVRVFGMILIICLTPFKKIMTKILAPIFCFSWGFFLMSCIIGIGVAGLFVGLASVIPHGFLYGALLWIVLRNNNERRYYAKNKIVQDVLKGLFGVLLFVTGCVLETLVATYFIPWIIRLSLI